MRKRVSQVKQFAVSLCDSLLLCVSKKGIENLAGGGVHREVSQIFS